MAEFYKMNPAKWDNGTAELTLEQEAALHRIVNAINKADEPCPANLHVLAGFFRSNTQKAKRLLRDLIAAKKVWVHNGKIYNEYAMNEVRIRSELRAVRQTSGRDGGLAKAERVGHGLVTGSPRVVHGLVDPQPTHNQPTRPNALGNNVLSLANASPREEERREEEKKREEK